MTISTQNGHSQCLACGDLNPRSRLISMLWLGLMPNSCNVGCFNDVRRHLLRRLSSGMRIRAIIGGFHLLNASRERLAQTMAALWFLEPEMVAPCHCTGEPAVALLRDAFGERVSPGAAGMIYQF